MRTHIGFSPKHFGIGIEWNNWAHKKHVLFINILWLRITINWSV